MKRTGIKQMAARVLEHLCRLPEGTELSTSEAVEQICPDAAIEFEDWFILHSEIFDQAGTYGLKLDDSKYDGMEVGLLHHIPYVVTHK